jgi:hypothetical protein
MWMGCTRSGLIAGSFLGQGSFARGGDDSFKEELSRALMLMGGADQLGHQ